MKPTDDRPDMNAALQRALRQLRELVSKTGPQLLGEVQRSPEQWSAELRRMLDTLNEWAGSAVVAPERQIRFDTYEELARLLAPELGVEWQAVQDWIVWKVEEEMPMTRRQFEAAQATDRRLGSWHIVLQCSYVVEERRQYRRLCRAYLRQGQAPIKALEARRVVTLDDLPREVNEAFLFRHETEMTFAIL
jgi:hypothetical protein